MPARASARRRCEARSSRTKAIPTVGGLLHHHHEAREPLIGERREAEQPHGLVDVGGEEWPEVEQDHVGHDLARPEDERRVAQPLAEGEAVVARRVDDLRPHEQAADDEAEVHEVVPVAVVQRRLVEAGDVPGDEDDDPHRVADAGAEQEAEQPAQPADPGERHEQVTRQEEHGQRSAHGDDRERDAEVGDQDVLEHVHALQIPLPDRVDRGDDREHGHEHAGHEERDPRPRCEVGTAPAQPSPAVQEERDRDQAAADHDRLERPGAPQVLGREHRVHAKRAR